MGIETTYYAVDWSWLEEGTARTRSLDFFFDYIDDDEEEGEGGEGAWAERVALPREELWENWRGASALLAELQGCTELTRAPVFGRLLRFCVGLAVVPDPEGDRMAPEAALGPPAALGEEYLGALDPATTTEYAALAEHLGALDLARLVANAPGPHLPALPGLVAAYGSFLARTRDRGWGVLLTAS